MAFCYDDFSPPKDINEVVQMAVRAVERDAKLTSKPMLPIVHLPQHADGDHQIDDAPDAILRVAEILRPLMIAIPERELGAGIFERTRTMRKIREALGTLRTYQPVHILGTGNPKTIALLAAAGADSFDGLEWCRFVVDGVTATLHHFQHYEFFRWQDALSGVSSITQAAAKDEAIGYAAKAIFHNLDFYSSWLEKLRIALKSERRLVEFMTNLLPRNMDDARSALPDVL